MAETAANALAALPRPAPRPDNSLSLVCIDVPRNIDAAEFHIAQDLCAEHAPADAGVKLPDTLSGGSRQCSGAGVAKAPQTRGTDTSWGKSPERHGAAIWQRSPEQHTWPRPRARQDLRRLLPAARSHKNKKRPMREAAYADILNTSRLCDQGLTWAQLTSGTERGRHEGRPFLGLNR